MIYYGLVNVRFGSDFLLTERAEHGLAQVYTPEGSAAQVTTLLCWSYMAGMKLKLKMLAWIK